MNTKKLTAIWATFIILIVAGYLVFKIFNTARDPLKSPPHTVVNDDYFSKVQKVFDNRCVACHSCYNSPCQVNLTSYDGALRGASQMDPYDFPLLEANPPTRLGIDAQTESGWRQKGFFSVLDKENSILLNLVSAAPKSVNTKQTYLAEESRTCPKTVDANYLKTHTMPYGLPRLKDSEVAILQDWVKNGHPGPEAAALKYYRHAQNPKTVTDIKDWEKLLNKKDFKHQLSARYLYEHLFSAHINFDNDTTEFFRIVRAKNAEGLPEEIATVRPFDDPKTLDFFYRFKKVEETIVHKNHIVFTLNGKAKAKFENDFLKSDWKTKNETLPGYSDEAANAFLVFKDIPARSRYQFFLDHARYFIMTFMKGPVCRGQTALNVINDHFWVMFIDPNSDVAITDPDNFAKTISFLAPPASKENKIDLFNEAKEKRWQAHNIKTQAMSTAKPLSYKSIWNGDNQDELNPNALLTVYRHFDSSNVLWGAKGVVPKTIWVMDYQIFEDIYYNLVAGYNVFGPVLHQINTRLYMDISRISSEDMFLNFMPSPSRAQIRQDWSMASPPKKDTPVSKIFSSLQSDLIKKVKFDYDYQGANVPSAFVAKTQNPKHEFLQNLIKERFSDDTFYKSFSLFKESLAETPVDLDGFSLEHDTREALYSINGKYADFIKFFPDVVFLRLKNSSGELKNFSIIRNRFHYNVSMMFFEDLRLNPKKDTLDILPEYAASYPNYYLDLNEKQLRSFVKELKLVNNQKGFEELMRIYGVPRSAGHFWVIYDWFNEDIKKITPLEAGLLDLNRYANF